MINPGEHVSIFGITNSGKSTLTRQMAQCFPRKIVFDRLNEWETENEKTVEDFDSFAEAYEVAFYEPTFTIVVRPQAGLSQGTLSELCNKVMAMVYRCERIEPHGIAIIMEEAWLYAPLMDVPPWLIENLLTGRHYKISLIMNAQRPALISKSMVSQSRHVFIGQFFEANDRKYYRECLGNIPELNRDPERFHFLWFRAGFPSQWIISKV